MDTGFKDKTLLILTPSYPNRDLTFITEIFVLNQVAELKNYFNRIIVIAPVFRSFGFLKKDKSCSDYSYDNVDVYFPRCTYIPISWMSKIIIDNRLQVVRKTIEQHNLRFDLIHAHFTWPSAYIGIQLKKRYGTPVVVTIHENGEWFDREIAMDHPLLNSAWSDADALIRVNKADITALNHYNDRVCSIPNGFSKNFYPMDMPGARERLGVPRDKKVLFAMGHLIKRKGFNYLIDAMERISQQRDDVICYIGGEDGGEAKSLQQQINQLQIGDRVHLLGEVPNTTVSVWMNACDLFVLPSLEESFGIVQIEALACGKPVVSARNRGSEEVISSSEYGLLAEPANPADLAEKIQAALDRTWDRDRILVYSAQFAWETVVRDIMKIYASCSDRRD